MILFSHTHLLRYTASPDLSVGEPQGLAESMHKCNLRPCRWLGLWGGEAAGGRTGTCAEHRAGSTPMETVTQLPLPSPRCFPRLARPCLFPGQTSPRMLPIATLAPRGPKDPSLATPLSQPPPPDGPPLIITPPSLPCGLTCPLPLRHTPHTDTHIHRLTYEHTSIHSVYTDTHTGTHRVCLLCNECDTH